MTLGSAVFSDIFINIVLSSYETVLIVLNWSSTIGYNERISQLLPLLLDKLEQFLRESGFLDNEGPPSISIVNPFTTAPPIKIAPKRWPFLVPLARHTLVIMDLWFILDLVVSKV